MVRLDGLNIEIGENVRACQKSGCGKYFSNHLRACPHCGGTDYIAKELTKEIEREIERQ